jgi:cobalt-zinc-cadmium efflux system outer membrane protein
VRVVRLAALLTTALLAATVDAQAIGEAEVIARIRSAALPEGAAAEAAQLLAQSEGSRASRWPNPSLGWQREHLTSPSEPQDTFELTVPVPLGGSRASRRALAEASVDGSRAQASRARSAMTLRALEAFYAALGAEREAAILQAAVARLDEAVRVATRRHEEGAISGYERTRLELETELLRSELQVARADLASSHASLAALLGLDPSAMSLRGELAVAVSPPAENDRLRPSLAHLRSAEQRARDASDAADEGYLPELSVTAGLTRLDATRVRYGYVAGVSLGLPLFDHGQDTAAESSARAGLYAAEAAMVERDGRLEAVHAASRLNAAQAEVQRFAGASAQRVELVERAAASAYRDGRASVVELVDAQRARTGVELRTLWLERAARKAELSLRAARGAFE